VYVKLGGSAMIVNAFDFHLAPLPPSSGEMANAWRPYVDVCVENFGASRCMFESNFPVDKGACSYPVLFNAFKRLARGASVGEKADLFAKVPHRGFTGWGTNKMRRWPYPILTEEQNHDRSAETR
jgi:hypothetical protein